MNWLTKFLNFVSKARNEVLGASATVVAIAGIPAALATAGVAIPAVVAGIATKVVIFGTTVGVVAAKVLPGNGENRSLKAAPGVDPETPKNPR